MKKIIGLILLVACGCSGAKQECHPVTVCNDDKCIKTSVEQWGDC